MSNEWMSHVLHIIESCHAVAPTYLPPKKKKACSRPTYESRPTYD